MGRYICSMLLSERANSGCHSFCCSLCSASAAFCFQLSGRPLAFDKHKKQSVLCLLCRFTYCAFLCCTLLGKMDALDVAGGVDHIVRCKNFDGGSGARQVCAGEEDWRR